MLPSDNGSPSKVTVPRIPFRSPVSHPTISGSKTNIAIRDRHRTVRLVFKPVPMLNAFFLASM